MIVKGHEFDSHKRICACGQRFKTLAEHRKHSIAAWKALKAVGKPRPK